MSFVVVVVVVVVCRYFTSLSVSILLSRSFNFFLFLSLLSTHALSFSLFISLFLSPLLYLFISCTSISPSIRVPFNMLTYLCFSPNVPLPFIFFFGSLFSSRRFSSVGAPPASIWDVVGLIPA